MVRLQKQVIHTLTAVARLPGVSLAFLFYTTSKVYICEISSFTLELHCYRQLPKFTAVTNDLDLSFASDTTVDVIDMSATAELLDV